MKDFFVSYNSADAAWAEWIAWVLEENGYTVVIQAWDFRPGGNSVLERQRATVEAERLVMVLSEAYFNAPETQPEWAAYFQQDPTGSGRKLLPFRVAPCQPQGMLASLNYTDLLGLSREAAETALLDALKDRLKPDAEPSFPGGPVPPGERVAPTPTPFPGEVRGNLPRSGVTQFVGREEDLTKLHEQMQTSSQVAIAAIAGMGGIGKTELALQYARRYGPAHYDAVCWLQVRGQEVASQIVNFARTYLDLTPPEDKELDQQVQWCWQRWPVTNLPTLMVCDDVTDFGSLQPYLPPQIPRFRVLMTTRLLYLGATVQPFEINVLSAAAALDLLRSIVGAERIDAQLAEAQSLCERLGYLPLALELAGRYLARKPQLDLTTLEARLDAKSIAAKALVKNTQTDADMTAQLGVAAAFELSIDELNVEEQKLASLLSLFAATAISWELVQDCLPDADEEDLEDWRDEGLVQNSLLERIDSDADTYQLHPLIQEFLRVRFAEAEWAEEMKQGYCQVMVRVARQVDQTLNRDQVAALTPLIPHLKEAATIWQASLASENQELFWPFTAISRFYESQGAYSAAEPWLQDCLKTVQTRLGDEHPHVATSLNNLALLYDSQGRYGEAEPLYQQALVLLQRLLGDEHPHVATSLNNLAALYESQGRYGEAEPLYQQALVLRQRLLGDEHPDVATSLNNLALLYDSQGRYGEAEPLYQQALSLRQRLLGDEHPHVASSLNNLALLYRSQGRYAEAEPLYLQALTIAYRQLGEAHPKTQTLLNNFVGLLQQVIEAGQVSVLSEHPATQGLLQQLQANDEP